MTDYLKAKYYKRAFLCALVLWLLSVAWIVFQPQPEPPLPELKIEHDTLWRTSTLQPAAPTAITNTGRTLIVPYLITERDTITIGDTLKVQMPVTQKRYDDSLYTAWVSGYQPQLDSITLRQPEIVTTITHTVVKHPPRWSIGPAIGAGVSIDHQHHPGIYLGFTAQYRLWPK